SAAKELRRNSVARSRAGLPAGRLPMSPASTSTVCLARSPEKPAGKVVAPAEGAVVGPGGPATGVGPLVAAALGAGGATVGAGACAGALDAGGRLVAAAVIGARVATAGGWVAAVVAVGTALEVGPQPSSASARQTGAAVVQRVT